MAAMPRETDTYYTPQVVERLLRDLPVLLDHIAPRDRDMPRPGKHNQAEPPHIRREEQMCKRADVEWAMWQLPQPNQRIIYLAHLGEQLTLREVAELVDLPLTTVWRHKTEGVRMMAWLLGWRDTSCGYGPENYEKVMRRIFGCAYGTK